MSTEDQADSQDHLAKHAARLFPCGQTRREFVWEMGAGFAGTAPAGLLGDGFFARHCRAAEAESAAPRARWRQNRRTSKRP